MTTMSPPDEPRTPGAAIPAGGPRSGPPAPAYGADASGLVYGYRFDLGRPGAPITAQAALDWLADDPAGGAFVWLHFDLSHAAAERWMLEHLALPEDFVETTLQQGRSTRIEQVGDALAAVINDVLYDFSFEATHLSSLAVHVTRRAIVTARRKPLRAVDKLRVSVRDGEAFRSPLELLVHLLRDQADVLVAIVRDATHRADGIEDALLATRLDAKRANLGALRRVLVRLRRLLAPEPAALFRLVSRPPGWVLEPDLQDLRQATEEFSVVLNDLAILLERIKLLQEEVAAQVNEQNNRLLLLLSMVTLMGLPFTVVGGLFGMNVGGIPLAEDPAGFWVIVGMVAAVTIGGMWYVFRRWSH